MAVPIHLWLTDDGGAIIRGSSDVRAREGSIELRGLIHNLSIPTDSNTGKLTGTRQHAPFQFDKEVDSSSPYLYKAVATGQTLKSAEIKWYRINDAGQEEEYFNILLEDVKVISVTPMMHDTRSCTGTGHLESVELRYAKITWKYLDGNVQYTDAWNERTTA
ncbi:MAG: type VI secretion system tube protein Hcp [Ewingella americana]|jgi:type VI secretion system secreted protein Hcp|uniref:Hcp family type VI secretion system effector n=1 Tax=Ewingella americana TaxID=41202 RepID=UPI002431F77A|nr:type VI secretion system tube protein TssD [Ewingella americana]MCI1679170.1 type VI secretion system tube protein Hcp [Ewingella americana]MCI1852186.1 type VI secretion system tube protein Hcp [Ewingella americana]MCI1862588.1 type VI secretion system tube protein Hcp [Ewingella americana]MCI2142630.1 type VI secretion system tube protein Hcp [Ewingella americana]MCI2166148.1 type VI secretion system tube protein Hcp [Ewingella americana]